MHIIYVRDLTTFAAFIAFPYITPYAALVDMSMVDRMTHNLTDHTTSFFIVITIT